MGTLVDTHLGVGKEPPWPGRAQACQPPRMPSLSKQQLRVVLDYVMEIWRGLGLVGFEIHCLVDDSEDLDFVAKVNTIYNRRVELVFSEDAFHLQPEEFRELVVHEGLHVSLDRLTSPVEKMLEGAQQGAAVALAVELEEQAVERLGMALAPRFPLPPAKLRALLAARKRAPRK